MQLLSVRGFTNAYGFKGPYAVLGQSLSIGLKHWTRSKHREHLLESSAYLCTTFSRSFSNRLQLMKKLLERLGWLQLRAHTRSRPAASNDLANSGFRRSTRIFPYNVRRASSCCAKSMVRTPILRGLLNTAFKPQRFISDSRRRLSSSPDPSSKKVQARFARISARLPKFLQRYTNPLIDAPVTHIVSFLVLHEITAVLPLVALFATFHYTSWLPRFVTQGKWFNDGVQKFGNYFKKKGWLGPEQKTRRYKWWNQGEGGVKIVTE